MRPARTLMALGAVVALVLTACGDDDDDNASDATTATTAAAAASATTAAPAAGGQTVTVKAIDYEFQGIPATVAPGTKFVLENDAPETLHEMVIVKLPDSETRPVTELVQLPEDQFDAAISGGQEGPPAAVLLAKPNKGELIQAVGDGTITEPGRYMVACFIPLGITADQYLNAPENPDGPPEIPGAGPPHITKGMFAEFTVK